MTSLKKIALLIGLSVIPIMVSLEDASASTKPICASLFAMKKRPTVNVSAGHPSVTPAQLTHVKQMIEAAFDALLADGRLRLPNALDVVVIPDSLKDTSNFTSGLEGGGHAPDTIIVPTSAPVSLHELGHAVFWTNFVAQPIALSKSLVENQKKIDAFVANNPPPVAADGRRLSAAEIAALDRYGLWMNQSLSSLQAKTAAPVLRGRFFRAYDEFFADSFAFAFSRVPKFTDVDDVKANRASAHEIHVTDIARDFSAKISPEEWGNDDVYLNAYNYFGPARSAAGSAMQSPQIAARVKVLGDIFSGVVSDIARFDQNANFEALATRDSRQANRELIARFAPSLPEGSIATPALPEQEAASATAEWVVPPLDKFGISRYRTVYIRWLTQDGSNVLRGNYLIESRSDQGVTARTQRGRVFIPYDNVFDARPL